MIKIIVGAILGVATGSVMAADNVTIYGIIDTGVEYLTNAAPTGGSVVRVPSNTGTYTSRLGFRGEEDLGGGLAAIFNLENGFSADTGALGQSGRLFGRTSVVGLKGNWGQVTLGRQWTMTFYSMVDTDLMGPNIYGLASFDTYLPGARADNSIAYRGTFAGLTVGGTYSPGRESLAGCVGETPGSATNCREWSGVLKYDWQSAGLSFGYDEQRGGGSATTTSFYNGASAIALTQASDKDARYITSGYWKLDKTKLVAGWLHRKVANQVQSVKSDIYYVGAAYQLTPALTVDTELAHVVNRDQNRNASLGILRGVYSLSKRTAVYAQTALLKNSALAQYTVSVGGSNTPAPGASQVGVMVGVRHFF
jgi:predicted porin